VDEPEPEAVPLIPSASGGAYGDTEDKDVAMDRMTEEELLAACRVCSRRRTAREPEVDEEGET